MSDNQAITDTAERLAKRKRRRILILCVLLVACIATTIWYLRQRAYESTDDAFLDGDIVQISPRVPGQVLKVHVQDNQHVKAGDLIAELDPADYQARLDEARGRLADLEAKSAGAVSNLEATSQVTGAVLAQSHSALAATREQVQVLRSRLNQDDAGVRAAQATLEQAQARRTAAEADSTRSSADVARYRALYAKDEVSRQLLDRAEAEARATAATLEAARQAVAAAHAMVDQATAGRATTAASLRQVEKQVGQAEGRVKEAQSAPEQVRVRQNDVKSTRAQIEQQRAAVRQAELNLSYTRIFAPSAGFITRKSVQPGNIVQAGQALMALVGERVWVVANFKETQLTLMRPGQEASITIDAYPDRTFTGKVDSVQSGSGARFSLLPPENATGNYVKVVQRVPVKIVFAEALPDGLRIGPGMSVVPEVKVR